MATMFSLQLLQIFFFFGDQCFSDKENGHYSVSSTRTSPRPALVKQSYSECTSVDICRVSCLPPSSMTKENKKISFYYSSLSLKTEGRAYPYFIKQLCKERGQGGRGTRSPSDYRLCQPVSSVTEHCAACARSQAQSSAPHTQAETSQLCNCDNICKWLTYVLRRPQEMTNFYFKGLMKCLWPQ